MAAFFFLCLHTFLLKTNYFNNVDGYVRDRKHIVCGQVLDLRGNTYMELTLISPFTAQHCKPS